MDSTLIGGIIIGMVAGCILTLALTTAYWLWCGTETKQADRKEREKRIRQINRGHIKYYDGLDIEDWL